MQFGVPPPFDLIMLSPLGVVNHKFSRGRNFRITFCWHVLEKLSQELMAVNERRL